LSLNYNPKVLNGWGSRPYQWEFSTSVQHELRRGLSMDVGYFRRWFGNFGVTDNLNVGPGDYGAFSVTAPVDSRLPDGGGYTVNGFFNLNPDKVAVVPNNYFTFAKDHGVQTEHWNGVDVTVNWRLARGMTFQGGVSTGRRVLDTCDVVDGLPEAALLTSPYCHQKENFLTDGKLIWTYNIPKVDVTVSGLFFSRPGPQLSANQVIRHRLADMAMQCDEARSMALRAALLADAEPIARSRAASGAKAKIGKCARFVAEQSVQLHGAMGVTEELDIGAYFKRLLAFDTLFGGSAHHYRRHATLGGRAVQA